jgi:RNA polymerase primary sigma factor
MDSFGEYLKKIAKYPLLTGAQEIELFRSISAAAALQEHPEPLTKEQQRIIKRGTLAKNRLINSNLRLVVHIAKRYTGVVKNLDMLDLVQEGTLGLIRAAETFDGSRGYKFSTYAYWWIRQNIQRGIDTKERTIRVPVHVSEKLVRVQKLKHELGIKFNRKPTKQELADALEISLERLYEILTKTSSIVSLNQKILHGDGTVCLGDILIDNSEDVFDDELDEINSNDSYEIIMQCIDMLEDKYKYIILHRSNIDGYEFKTYKQISEVLGVCRERVRQLYDQALHKLQILLRMHKHFAHFEFGNISGSILDDFGI